MIITIYKVKTLKISNVNFFVVSVIAVPLKKYNRGNSEYILFELRDSPQLFLPDERPCYITDSTRLEATNVAL